MLDLAFNEWTAMKSMIDARYHPGVAYNDKTDTLYLTGGYSDPYNKKVFKYSFDETVGWERLSTECPRRVKRPAVGSHGWFFFVTGVSMEEDSKNELLVMDIRTENWQVINLTPKLTPRHAPALTIVENFFGKPAILILGGEDDISNTNKVSLQTSEYVSMHDPEDPSSFTIHHMKDIPDDGTLRYAPIAELENEIIFVNNNNDKVYRWNTKVETSAHTHHMFEEISGATPTKVGDALPYFKVTTRWDSISCGSNPNKFTHTFASCLDAFKLGLLLPDPGQSISIKLTGGTVTQCTREDPYTTGQSCPDGWFGKKGEEKCLKIHEEPEDNINAARQCYREGADLFQDEDTVWNSYLIDATHFSQNFSLPVYPGYIHLGLYQKQSGNNHLYHRNGVRV